MRYRLPVGYGIRAYSRKDAAALAAVEKRSSALFAKYGYPSLAAHSLMKPAEFDAFAAANETLVAAHRDHGPAGYAILHRLGNFLHLRELAVDPAHGRRGLGAALLGEVIAKSRDERYDGVSLTTFRILPFNEHFYAGHGFVECPVGEAPALFAEQFLAEVPPGIAPERRLLMLRRNIS